MMKTTREKRLEEGNREGIRWEEPRKRLKKKDRSKGGVKEGRRKQQGERLDRGENFFRRMGGKNNKDCLTKEEGRREGGKNNINGW